MSLHYLQKKITPVANNYIIVGTDGNLTTSSTIPSGLLPTINITANSNIDNIEAHCLDITTDVTKNSATSYTCKPTRFGYWKILATYTPTGQVISDVILVSTITTYSCDLTSLIS